MKYTQFTLLLISVLFIFQSCIKDDFVDDMVDPVLRITTSVDTIEAGTTFQFESVFLNNIGNEIDVTTNWASSNTDVLTIDENGLATAIAAGSSTITVTYNDGATEFTDVIEANVGETTVVSFESSTGIIETTTFYTLEGDFVYEETADGVRLDIAENYEASAGLPGLYIYLSNNKNSIANALEIGEVTTFSGAHAYEVPNVGFSDYQFIVYFCKPFNVKVGEATL